MKRVLPDKNLPHLLGLEFPEHDVRTVAQAGWKGVKNGQLLRLASEQFDVFVTADRSIPHQQPVAKLPLGFVILSVGSLALDDLLPYLLAIRDAIASVSPGEVVWIRRRTDPR